MSQILHCDIIRFITSLSEEDARGETHAFLSAIFKSMEVQEVTRVGIKYTADEASHTLSRHLVIYVEPLPMSELLARIQGQDLSVEMCAGVRTFGINFDIEQRFKSSGCTLYYRFGPLPVLELGVLYFADVQSPREWAESLVSSKAVDVIRTQTDWLRLNKRYGAGDRRYLLWKRDKLLGEPTATTNALQAGRVLRELCSAVWNKRSNDLAKKAENIWPGSNVRFIRAFDKALVDEVGFDKLSKLLEPLGTTIDQWLEVDPIL
jgi:hypothetical protein